MRARNFDRFSLYPIVMVKCYTAHWYIDVCTVLAKYVPTTVLIFFIDPQYTLPVQCVYIVFERIISSMLVLGHEGKLKNRWWIGKIRKRRGLRVVYGGWESKIVRGAKNIYIYYIYYIICYIHYLRLFRTLRLRRQLR